MELWRHNHFLKMAAGSHIGFDLDNDRPPTKCNCWCQRARKIHGILYRSEIICDFGLFWPKCGWHGNFLSSLEIQIAYLNSPTPKPCYSREKLLDILYRTEISCTFGLFLPKFVCHGNSLSSLENPDSIFEFPDPENPTLHEKGYRYLVQKWSYAYLNV